MSDDDFATFFGRATGNPPYRYQVELAEAEPPPDVVAVPTGAGKTQALLTAWLHQRRRRAAPRKLVYALPMRTLVEQTNDVALAIRDRLTLSAEELPIHVLMGGAEPSDWRRLCERDQILIGTIDMLLSRALNRGYGESRFAWPVSFGLLNDDCRWVFDEVQLMGPARATSAQLDGLRRRLGTFAPCETMWVSATVDPAALETVDRPQLGRTLELPDEDRKGPLATRLDAPKSLERLDFADTTPTQFPRNVATEIAARHAPGTRSIVVLNTVKGAQDTARHLRRELRGVEPAPAVVLLHSRFRPPDRAERMREATRPMDRNGAGTIVVSTQVIEAGVDLSSRLLATEGAPFSSIVQRLGRCNRAGEFDQATALWLDRGEVTLDKTGDKVAAPYLPEDVNSARDALTGLIGTSLSPAALSGISVAETVERPAILRLRDLIDLFDTSPDLSGLDVDIAPFIRPDDDRSATVFFRELRGQAKRAPATIDARDQARPEPDELVGVPLSALGKRDVWVFDHVDEVWLRRRAREVSPGGTAMLDAAEGGYDALTGWDEKSTAAVAPNGPSAKEVSEEGIGGDPGSVASAPEELGDHLGRVRAEALQLAELVGLPKGIGAALSAAASLHDIGKAHAVFQETLRSAMGIAPDGEPAAKLWAKSGTRGGRHRRPYFRHELASALAVEALNGGFELERADLVTYLIASHHGKVRMSIRPAADERPPSDEPSGARFALGIVDGDALPVLQTPLGQLEATVLDLSCMELGAERSWTRRAATLRDDPDLGPFRLALLEALLRIADWKASA